MMEEIPVNWKVPEDVKTKFQRYCDQMGETNKKSLAGAMVLWQHMPASIQRIAKLEIKCCSMQVTNKMESLL